MRCKACNASIECRTRSVEDETGRIHVVWEDLCNYCIVQSSLRYSEDDLRDIYTGVQYANFKVIC